jgi:hypothetical protein
MDKIMEYRKAFSRTHIHTIEILMAGSPYTSQI